MSTQEIPSQADFRDRAKTNEVPIARLIGFQAKDDPGDIIWSFGRIGILRSQHHRLFRPDSLVGFSSAAIHFLGVIPRVCRKSSTNALGCR